MQVLVEQITNREVEKILNGRKREKVETKSTIPYEFWKVAR